MNDIDLMAFGLSDSLCDFVSRPLCVPACVQVKYWRKQEDSEAGAQKVLVSSRDNHTKLEGMKPDSHYLIEVRACNAAGCGPPSQHFHIYTKKARRLTLYCMYHR